VVERAKREEVVEVGGRFLKRGGSQEGVLEVDVYTKGVISAYTFGRE